MRKLTLLTTILTLVLMIYLFLPEIMVGQPPPPPTKPTQTPIDGGLAILAALGGLYGIKKLRSSED